MTIVGPMVGHFLLAQKECIKDTCESKIKCCSRRRDLDRTSEKGGREPVTSDRSPLSAGRTHREEQSIPYTMGSHQVRVNDKPYVLTAVKNRSNVFETWMRKKKYQLQEQCRRNDLPRSGNKEALAERLESCGAPYPTECCLLYTSPSPRDLSTSRMPSSA